MIHVTCRLTAKNQDQLRNPTLGNRAWATFTFFIVCSWPFCSGVSAVSGVQVAARSLIQLFREKNPHLLRHKYRVKRRLLVNANVMWGT